MSLPDDLTWWEQSRASDDYKRLQTRPVAYFCAESALTSRLKTYSGGLGVLAGDILREAAAQKFPLVGVGLLYGQTLESLKLDNLDDLDLESLKSGNLDQGFKTSRNQDQEYPSSIFKNINDDFEPVRIDEIEAGD